MLSVLQARATALKSSPGAREAAARRAAADAERDLRDAQHEASAAAEGAAAADSARLVGNGWACVRARVRYLRDGSAAAECAAAAQAARKGETEEGSGLGLKTCMRLTRTVASSAVHLASVYAMS